MDSYKYHDHRQPILQFDQVHTHLSSPTKRKNNNFPQIFVYFVSKITSVDAALPIVMLKQYLSLNWFLICNN